MTNAVAQICEKKPRYELKVTSISDQGDLIKLTGRDVKDNKEVSVLTPFFAIHKCYHELCNFPGKAGIKDGLLEEYIAPDSAKRWQFIFTKFRGKWTIELIDVNLRESMKLTLKRKQMVRFILDVIYMVNEHRFASITPA